MWELFLEGWNSIQHPFIGPIHSFGHLSTIKWKPGGVKHSTGCLRLKLKWESFYFHSLFGKTDTKASNFSLVWGLLWEKQWEPFRQIAWHLKRGQQLSPQRTRAPVQSCFHRVGSDYLRRWLFLWAIFWSLFRHFGLLIRMLLECPPFCVLSTFPR
jgi:hypothetical protein